MRSAMPQIVMLWVLAAICGHRALRSGQFRSSQQGDSSQTHARSPRLSLSPFTARLPDIQ